MAAVNPTLRRAFAARLTEFRGTAEKDDFWRSYDLNSAKMGRYENIKEGPSMEKIVEISLKTSLSPNWLLLGIEPKLLPAQNLKRLAAELGHATVDKTTSGPESDGKGEGQAGATRRVQARRASRR